MMYPVIGSSNALLGFVQDNLTDREVNPRTIGWPGGSGTSERKISIQYFYFFELGNLHVWVMIEKICRHERFYTKIKRSNMKIDW